MTARAIAGAIPVLFMAWAWGTGNVTAAASAQQLNLDLGNHTTMEMALIPAGTFTMGSPMTEQDRIPDEVEHNVTISQPFYMGVTDVTVSEFAAFVKDTGYKTDAERAGWSVGIAFRDGRLVYEKVNGRSWRNPSFPQTGNDPAVQISWYDAHAFCEWLSRKTGKVIALPTEAQWEYAGRAGTKTTFLWDDDPDGGKGWANGGDISLHKLLPHPQEDWRFFNWDDGFVYTSPVKSFRPNAFGLYDITGNVWQWCSDYYGPYAKGPVTDPPGPALGEQRVARGGAWYLNPLHSHLAHRQHNLPTQRSDSYGFRVTMAVDGHWTGKLVILKAEYGDLASGVVVDVTDKVSAMVRNDTLSMAASNEFGDPVEGVHKQLKVDYTLDGNAATQTVREGETLRIPPSPK